MIFGNYRHTAILAAWQRVAICQEYQSAFRPNRKRPFAETCRWIETSLRHLHISADGHFIKKFGQDVSTILTHGVGASHDFIWFCPAYLCGYSFAKVLVGIIKRQTGNGKSSSNGLSVFAVPSFALLPANTLGKQKISLGQAEKLETKGKIIQSVWHRLTRTSKSSWTSPRFGSASISLNVFRMWARRKLPTETLFMLSRMERLMRKLPRWPHRAWKNDMAKRALTSYSLQFRHLRTRRMKSDTRLFAKGCANWPER